MDQPDSTNKTQQNNYVRQRGVKRMSCFEPRGSKHIFTDIFTVHLIEKCSFCQYQTHDFARQRTRVVMNIGDSVLFISD